MAEQYKSDEPKTPRGDVPDAVRRRIATAGLIAPVIVTLAGRTAWATGGGGGGSHCTESGQLSGNLSNPGPACGGQGCSPGYWKTHLERWHTAYPPTATFHSVFGVNAFPGATLYQVINGNPSVQLPANCTPTSTCQSVLKACGMHSVAALQNAATEVSFIFDTLMVKTKFAAAYATGTKSAIEWQKNEFDTENNRGCPLS